MFDLAFDLMSPPVSAPTSAVLLPDAVYDFSNVGLFDTDKRLKDTGTAPADNLSILSNQMLWFDGVDDYLYAAPLAADLYPTAFSFSLDIDIGTNANGSQFFTEHTYNTFGQYWVQSNGNLGFYQRYYNSSGSFTQSVYNTDTGISLVGATKLTVTVSSSGLMQIYIDGLRVIWAQPLSQYDHVRLPVNGFNLGITHDLSGPYNGLLGNFQLWKTELSEADVLALYTTPEKMTTNTAGGFVPDLPDASPDDCIAWYPLCDGPIAGANPTNIADPAWPTATLNGSATPTTNWDNGASAYKSDIRKGIQTMFLKRDLATGRVLGQAPANTISGAVPGVSERHYVPATLTNPTSDLSTIEFIVKAANAGGYGGIFAGLNLAGAACNIRHQINTALISSNLNRELCVRNGVVYGTVGTTYCSSGALVEGDYVHLVFSGVNLKSIVMFGAYISTGPMLLPWELSGFAVYWGVTKTQEECEALYAAAQAKYPQFNLGA